MGAALRAPKSARVRRIAAALAGRFAELVATILAVAALVFALLHLAPGDAIDLLPNSDEVRPLLEARWHLDEPLPVRFALFVKSAATGDLGTSLAYRPGASVSALIAAPALRSGGRLAGALALAMLWGTALAWWTSGRSGRLPGALRGAVAAISIVPVFLAAHLLVYGLNEAAFSAMEAGLIGRPGWFALPDQPSALRAALAVVVLAVASGALTEVHGAAEDALTRIRGAAYVDAARARGEAVWPHVAGNLVPPLAVICSTRTALLAGGLVVLEKVLLLDGLGSMLWQAALLRDHDLAAGIAIAIAAAVACARFASEGVRVAVDPRSRVQGVP